MATRPPRETLRGMKTSSPTNLPPADTLPVGPRASVAFRALRAVIAPLIRLLFRVRIEGRDNIPRSGTYVIAANHLGWLDSFLVLLAFPGQPRVHFLGAVRGLVARPLQWRVVRAVGGYIPVDMDRHGDRCLYRHVNRCLESGGAVAIFPEACYGTPGQLQPFRKGFAHFAATAGVPVIPVALFGTERLWLRREVRVVVSAPVAGSDPRVLLDLTHARLEQLLRQRPAGAPRFRPLERTLSNLF